MANCIDGIRVDENYRRRGIGSQRLAAQLEYLRGRGMQTAETGCETINDAAIAFLRKQGWYVLEETDERLGEDMIIGIKVFGCAL